MLSCVRAKQIIMTQKKIKNIWLRLLLKLSIVGVLLLVYSHLESRWLKTTHVEISKSDIPDAFIGKKIIFISDIHHGPYFSIRRVEKLVKRINKLKPDIILLGGDYVHREAEYITPLFDEFVKLKATYGVYGVLGNHDHWEDATLTRKLMQRNGIQICDNMSYWVSIGNDSIKIGGVGDLWEDKQNLSKTTSDVKPSDYCILISHSPDYIETMSSDCVDLVVAGHTHGGQVSLFGLWAPIVPSKYGQKYRYGLKTFDHTQAYITSGVGTITPPLRFFCRPEIVVFELK